MPYTVSCTPAPVTFTIWPKLDWQFLPGIAWVCFVSYKLASGGWHHVNSDKIFNLVMFAMGSIAAILSVIRRERIEIYPDRILWRKTYFGISRSKTAPLSDVLGAEWSEAIQEGKGGRQVCVESCVEFYLTTGTVKAGFGISFDDFDRMRGEIRNVYPKFVDSWTRSSVHSKNFTLLNLN